MGFKCDKEHLRYLFFNDSFRWIVIDGCELACPLTINDKDVMSWSVGLDKFSFKILPNDGGFPTVCTATLYEWRSLHIYEDQSGHV